jgi:type VI secretion system secreted protein Hcp
MGSQSPRDAASGLPTGKRQHDPIVITKELDIATIPLYQACSSQEVFASLNLNLVGRPSSGAGEKVYYTINLTNAQISTVNRYTPPPKPHGHGPSRIAVLKTLYLEEVKITYQTITVTNVAGSTSASDDWEANP